MEKELKDIFGSQNVIVNSNDKARKYCESTIDDALMPMFVVLPTSSGHMLKKLNKR